MTCHECDADSQFNEQCTRLEPGRQGGVAITSIERNHYPSTQTEAITTESHRNSSLRNFCAIDSSLCYNEIRISTIWILKPRPRVNTLHHLELARFNRIYKKKTSFKGIPFNFTSIYLLASSWKLYMLFIICYLLELL